MFSVSYIACLPLLHPPPIEILQLAGSEQGLGDFEQIRLLQNEKVFKIADIGIFQDQNTFKVKTWNIKKAVT